MITDILKKYAAEQRKRKDQNATPAGLAKSLKELEQKPLMKIISNNKPRPIIYGHELTPEECEEFDYLDSIEDATFFRYKNEVYDISQFMKFGHEHCFSGDEFKVWSAYQSESVFHGLVIRLTDENDGVIVGTYKSTT